MGCIPFEWDEKKDRLLISKKPMRIYYWLCASIFSWTYNAAVALKYVYHWMFNEKPLPPADAIFHLFWISAVGISSLLDFNNVVLTKSIVIFTNNTLDLDDKLTSMYWINCKFLSIRFKNQNFFKQLHSINNNILY